MARVRRDDDSRRLIMRIVEDLYRADPDLPVDGVRLWSYARFDRSIEPGLVRGQDSEVNQEAFPVPKPRDKSIRGSPCAGISAVRPGGRRRVDRASCGALSTGVTAGHAFCKASSLVRI